MMRSLHRGVVREDGVTLIETLATMALLSFAFAAFAMLISSTIKHTAVITNESVIQTETRTAVAQLAKDIRQAYPPSAAATSSFETGGGPMSNSWVTFYSPDNTYSAGAPSAFHLREISYQLSNGKLQRWSAISSNTTGPPWTIPATGTWVSEVSGVVNTDIFTYYNGNNPPTTTTDPAAVRTVVVKLTVQPPGAGGVTYTYSDSATVRVTTQ
jgi:type II secretory pathway component PulJ